MAKQSRRPYATITIPRWNRVEVPEGMLRLAAKRTEYLHGIAMRTTLHEMLQSAYIQGVNDCEQALSGSPENSERGKTG